MAVFDKLNMKKENPKNNLFLGFCNNRRDRIRTCDFYVPNVALYQAEPHADNIKIIQNLEAFGNL